MIPFETRTVRSTRSWSSALSASLLRNEKEIRDEKASHLRSDNPHDSRACPSGSSRTVKILSAEGSSPRDPPGLEAFLFHGKLREKSMGSRMRRCPDAERRGGQKTRGPERLRLSSLFSLEQYRNSIAHTLDIHRASRKTSCAIMATSLFFDSARADRNQRVGRRMTG